MWNEDNKDELLALLDAHDALGEPPPVTLLVELTDSYGVIVEIDRWEDDGGSAWGFQIEEAA